METVITSDLFINETNKGNVVVDFFATWCGPCRMMAPIYHKLSEDIKEVKFVAVDIDKNHSLAQKFDVMGVPTFLFLKDGKEVDRIVGGMDYEHFKAKIKEVYGSFNK